MAKSKGKYVTTAALIAIGIIAGGAYYISQEVKPLPAGPPYTFRLSRPTPAGEVWGMLQKRGIIRNARAMKVYAMFHRQSPTIGVGSYSVSPGFDADAIFAALRKPLRQMVRIPETNWSRRTANVLQMHDVASADQYLELVNNPAQFKDEVSFPLPTDSLEGYLYPDTYDLPPLIGAKEVIDRQLHAFEAKVYKPLGKPKELQRLLTVASMVELETKYDEERPLVAAVIENRLKKNMPLQIDSTILYAQQKWKDPTGADVRNTVSPYNTYKNKGLPPGPICSPTIKSIQAALHPAKNNYLYYVALPGGKQLFAATYKDHVANVKKRLAALAKIAKEAKH